MLKVLLVPKIYSWDVKPDLAAVMLTLPN